MKAWMNLVASVLLLLLPGLARAMDRCPSGLPSTTAMRVFQDTCYQFVSEERYWPSARDYCIQYGGRLVKIDNADTKDFIVTTLNNLWWRNRGVWIGLHDRNSELNWQWAGNTRYSNDRAGWFNWGSGHPEAFLHSLRDCVRMARGSGQWRWHETPCSKLGWKYRFICQYEMIPTTPEPTHAASTPEYGILRGGPRSGLRDSSDQRGRHVSTSVPTTTSTERTFTSAKVEENHAVFDYNAAEAKLPVEHAAQDRTEVRSSWLILCSCVIATSLVLLLIVLLWRRRANRQLRLVAIAPDDADDNDDVKDAKLKSLPQYSSSGHLDSLLDQHAKTNHYEPEPRSLNVKVVGEGLLKNADTEATLPGQYCPMNGRKGNSQPDDNGYLPMGPPPDYSTVTSQAPLITYSNVDRYDSATDVECGMMGYDVPPPMNVYSEIPEIPDNNDIIDEDGNHIYESLDVAKPQ